jgi:hypothetical protein
MQISQIPTKIPVPFGNSAGPSYITTPLPIPSQQGVQPGRASFTDGFVPANFEPVASGGIPPWGADMNGVLNQITQWLRWAQAGGVPTTWDSAFSASVGGYPKGGLVQSLITGHYWVSSVDNNISNPDTGGSGWIQFPDLIVQQQAGNYGGAASGTANATVVTLSPAPSTAASMLGVPVRYLSVGANSITNPTVKIASLSSAWNMVNTDGTALTTSQIARAGQFVEGFWDGTQFQVTSPTKPPAASTSPFVPGCIYMCPTNTPFAGTVECNGALYAISTYPNMYNKIGNLYGGDGVNNFRVPDYRGMFMRGWDHGRGVDPNAGSRGNSGGGVTGDNVGTTEGGAASGLTVGGAANYVINFPAFYYGAGLTGGTPLVSQLLPGAFGTPPYTWPPYAPNNGHVFASDLLGGNPVNLIPAVDAGWLSNQTVPYNNVDHGYICQGLAGSGTLSANISGQGAENRPINVNIMYVIAY